LTTISKGSLPLKRNFRGLIFDFKASFFEVFYPGLVVWGKLWSNGIKFCFNEFLMVKGKILLDNLVPTGQRQIF